MRDVTADRRPERPFTSLTNLTLNRILGLGETLLVGKFDGFEVDLVGGAGDLCEHQGRTQGDVGTWAQDRKLGTAIVFTQPFGGGRGHKREEEVVEMIKQFINSNKYFRYMCVVTVGTKGGDFLTPEQYAKFEGALNHTMVGNFVRRLQERRPHKICYSQGRNECGHRSES